MHLRLIALLVLYHAYITRGLTNVPPTGSMQLKISCDDQIENLYFDGRRQGDKPNRSERNEFDTYTVPSGNKLIAVECKDRARGEIGVIAKMENYLKTDSSWKCTRSPSSNWMGLSYDDTGWSPAEEYDRWDSEFGTARWIRVDDRNRDNIYCRKLYACEPITNCERIVCTTGANQGCTKCRYDGPGVIKAYRKKSANGYNNRICEQICSWRPDSVYCYPGRCPDVPASCNCAPGFEGNNCMTITERASIAACLARVEVYEGGSVIDFTDVNCNETNTFTYTNKKENRIWIDWTTVFVGPDKVQFPEPYYIRDFEVGIIEASIRLNFTRESATVNTSTIDCSAGHSKSNPDMSPHNCDQTEEFGMVPEHGDRLEITLEVMNGGFVEINNYDYSSTKPSVRGPLYYSGQIETRLSTVVFDYVRPDHCSFNTSCEDNWLDVGNPFTNTGGISVEWSGWLDPVSSVHEYDIYLYKMEPLGVGGITLDYRVPLKMVTLGTSSNGTLLEIDPLDSGMYCVLLSVIDAAGNYAQSRRFFLYDDISNVTTRDHNPLWVDSAAQNTSYVWITTLYDKIDLKWPGHFWNEFHTINKLLNEIAPHHNEEDIVLEDASGQPPNVRSMEEIPNVYGIVKFDVTVLVGDKGGTESSSTSALWETIQLFQLEEKSLAVPRIDGDAVTIYVRGFDVMNKSVTDFVVVHVDSSPPIIEDVWLVKNGHTQLAVHHSQDLFKLNLKFTSYDHHSGLKTVRWELNDKEDPGIVHADGNLPVRRPTDISPDCYPPECYCIRKGDCFFNDFSIEPDQNQMNISKGKHDYDYYFVLTITNNAMLQTTYKYQITIDTSPPHAGVVNDGISGEQDFDYQQSLTLKAWWEGFFDKQNGVLFYQYSFGEACRLAGSFTVPETSTVFRTTETFASVNVSAPGTYYVTVVAYNAALDPSPPVCSDGVTIDITSPDITSIRLEGLSTHEGLAVDNEGQFWYITHQAERFPLLDISDNCSIGVNQSFDVDLYPRAALKEHQTDAISCDDLNPATHLFYLKDENKIELSWLGEDLESEIYNYEVGMGITDSVTDLLPYESTHGHRHFITYHAGLGDETTLYIHIKAINRAGMKTIKIFGPIFVYILPPYFNGEIDVDFAHQEDNGFLLVSWNTDNYDITQIDNMLIESFKLSIGTTAYAEDVYFMTDINNYLREDNICPQTTPPSCVAVPLDEQNWNIHGRHTYYFTLGLFGVNGLSTLVTSSGYEHFHGPPIPGVVMVIPVNEYANQLHDIQYHSSLDTVHVRWTGFSHPDQTITYRVGLGTTPYTTNVVDFVPALSGRESIVFEDLDLEFYQVYYCIVRATTVDGSVNVPSKSLQVLPIGHLVPGLYIVDGYRCGNTTGHEIDFNHHVNGYTEHGGCGKDMDYQTSVTTLQAFWEIPNDMTLFVISVMVSVEEYDPNTGKWTFTIEASDYGHVNNLILPNIHLIKGSKYRFSVEICHPTGCFLPSQSDGVWIVSDQLDPPLIMSVIEEYTSYSTEEASLSTQSPLENTTAHEDVTTLMEGDTSYGLKVVWKPPFEPSIGLSIPILYHWNIIIDHGHSHEKEWRGRWTVIPVHDVRNYTEENKTLNAYVIHMIPEMKFTSCLKLALRATSPTGHTSTGFKTIGGCDVSTKQVPTVIDAIGDYNVNTDVIMDIHLEENALWAEPDKGYTPSESVLSAVWPGLWYEHYLWKVVSDTEVANWGYRETGHQMRYSDYHCASPAVLSCGQTKENFINVHDLQLRHGSRYHICIQANATVAHFESFDQNLPEVDTCSTGIVVDRYPPEPGNVWIGTRKEKWRYQVNNHELAIYWNDFVDVERSGTADHYSGIHYYEYAIGSHQGGVDVKDLTNVGVTNMVVAHGIILQSGVTYYVTVKATDFAGRTAAAHSNGITIDTTSPDSVGALQINHQYIASRDQLAVNFRGVFNDAESGISHYRWCIGTQKLHCNIVPYIETTDSFTSPLENETLLIDGSEYFFTVQAMNGVGLMSQLSSSAVVIDQTGPVPGFIYEFTDKTRSGLDIDFQTSLKEYHTYWQGFSDPHSPILGYIISIGKCKLCDDILRQTELGLETGVSLYNISLEEGMIYYTTVRACNAADLCTTVTSDGVIPDTTPPVVSHVLDGVAGEDIDYQISRNTLSAHWINAHDLHSGLSHYEWWAGTSRGQSDIYPATRQHLRNHFLVQVSDPLPVAMPIYVTLKVVDKAGLFTIKTTNAFMVDPSPPLFVETVTLDHSLGSIYVNTLIWSTSLKVVWSVKDDECPILKHYISVLSRSSDNVFLPTMKVLGDTSSYVFTNVSLADGEKYRVRITSCNAAINCQSTESDDILVDNSPPSAGAFAIETEHAAALNRHRDGAMTYEIDNDLTKLNLTWLGFADPHSGILQYHILIGSQFGGSDIVGGTNPFAVPTQAVESHKDEGFLHTSQITLPIPLQKYSVLFITIWAENKVGLLSERLHGTFTAVPSGNRTGSLDLDRRCEVKSCSGHCTCGDRHHYCHSVDSCTDVTGTAGYQSVLVSDVIEYQFREALRSGFTPSQCSMAAMWEPDTDITGKTPIRYEWSVGLKGEQPGSGLMDPLQEPIWRETGHEIKAIFTTQGTFKKEFLLPLVTYSFYVRVWYDSDHYSIYTSPGIRTDSSPPEISRSYKVKELAAPGTAADVDFVASTDGIYVTWENVFRDAQSNITGYTVSMDTVDGGSGLTQEHFDPSVTGTDLTVNLREGTKYFVTVEAKNDAGLTTKVYSDGFQPDLTKPLPGVVWDGNGLEDIDYLTYETDTSVRITWRGFSDAGSGINKYKVCLGTRAAADDVAPCTNVGLAVTHTFLLPRQLPYGLHIVASVYAVDAVGHYSDVVTSDGFHLDKTPPEAVAKFNIGDNIIRNPSFEQDIMTEGEHSIVLTGWNAGEDITLVQNSSISAEDGSQFVHIRDGSIAQSLATTPGEKYRLSFYTAHHKDTTLYYSHPVVHVNIPGNRQQFTLVKPEDASATWMNHIIYFIAKDSTSIIEIGAIGRRSAILVDDVTVSLLTPGERSDHMDPNHPLANDIEPIHVHVTYVGDHASVSVSWDFIDTESPVQRYLWAIGTVKGGTQLQSFTSVGHRSHANTQMLQIQHGTEIHVTVVVENAAGLTAVSHSDPVMVDLTPPDICCLQINKSSKPFHFSSNTLALIWEVSDAESGVEQCSHAIGSSPGSQSITSWQNTDTILQTRVVLPSEIIQATNILHITIRCVNYVGLYVEFHSGEIYNLISAPDVTSMYAEVITQSHTTYPTRDSHQSDTHALCVGWGGYDVMEQLTKIQLSIRYSTGEVLQPWIDINKPQMRFAEISSLLFVANQTYTVQMQVLNAGGVASDIIQQHFTVETSPPKLTGTTPKCTWANEWTIEMDWSEVFHSFSDLVYEVTIGTRPGGVDVLSWTESEATVMRMSGVDSSKTQHITVTAINKAGLYRTLSFISSYTGN